MRSLLLGAALLCPSTPAFADIHISDAKAFETSANMKNGAVFLTIENGGKEADKLVSVSTAAAARPEIHEMAQDKGVMKMRRVDAVTIEPGQKVALSPGGYHIMLMDLDEPLKPGEKHKLTLQFEKAGKIDTDFDVQSRSVPAADHSHHDMGH